MTVNILLQDKGIKVFILRDRKQNSGVSFPPSPPPSEATDRAVTEAHRRGDPERREHGCCFASQIV